MYRTPRLMASRSWLSEATGVHISSHGISISGKKPDLSAITQSTIDAARTRATADSKNVIQKMVDDVQKKLNGSATPTPTASSAAAAVLGSPFTLIGGAALAVALLHKK